MASSGSTGTALAHRGALADLRARRTGILQVECALGQEVARGDRLGGLSDSFGRRLAVVKADRDGIVVGRTEMPLVNTGDALMHIGSRA